MNEGNKRLLVVAHVPSLNTKRLLDAVIKGCSHEDINDISITHRPPLEAGPEDVLNSDCIILGTTENFGYMSGAMKDFFDRSYYPCLEKTQGMPYALYIRAGMDGTGTRNAIEKITSGLRWRAVQEPLTCRGPWQDRFEDQCEELGMTIAAGLEAGIY